MAAGREIKKKIGSIQNTKKVTSAMQMVAASKMRRTQQRMHAARPYAHRLRQIIGHLASARPEYTHQYMTESEEVSRISYIVISTDKGQCGGLNANLFRALLKDINQWRQQSVQADSGDIRKQSNNFFPVCWRQRPRLPFRILVSYQKSNHLSADLRSSSMSSWTTRSNE